MAEEAKKEPRKPRRLRSRVNPDGSTQDEPIWFYPIDFETGKPFEGEYEGGRPGVGIRLRHIPRDEYRALIKTATTHEVDPETKVWSEKVDNVSLGDAVVTRAVQEWYGIEAADGSDLPCTDPVKLAVIDQTWRSEIHYLATRTLTPVEVAAREASFRQSPRVGDVVEVIREDDTVLSTSH